MHHLRNTLLVLILLAVVSGGTYVFILSQDVNNKSTTSKIASSAPQLPQREVLAKEEERSVTSIDATETLTMKMSTKEKTVTYSFTVNKSDQPLFTQTFEGENYSLGLPDNSWSPNEKYIFIEKNGDGVRNALVFKVDGAPFPNGEKFLDVYSLFLQRNLPYTFVGATGWADYSLLMIETVKADGSRGPKFWFEVPNGAFIQLAR